MLMGKNVATSNRRGNKFKLFLAGKMAKLWPSDSLIGVVGSEGKSTTVYLAKELLARKFKVSATTGEKDLISEIAGLLLKVPGKNQKLIVEEAINHFEDADHFISLVNPQTLILTNLSIPQGDFLGDVKYFQGQIKKILSHSDARLIVNYDDEASRELVKELGSPVFFGLDSSSCHVWAGNLKIQNLKTRFELNYGVERVEVVSPLLGFHQVSPQLAAATLAINYGLPLTTVKNVLESVNILPGHMEASDGFNGSIVIDDSAQLSPEALSQAIETLNHVAAKRRIAIICGVADLGLSQESVDKALALKMYKQRLDFLFLVGEESVGLKGELLKLGFPADRIETEVASYQQIISKVLKLISRGDVILIKLNNQLRADEIISRLTKLK